MNNNVERTHLKNQNPLFVDIQTISLAGIPLFLAISAASMFSMIAPIYAGLAGYDYDPSYAYLFNGVSFILGYVPKLTLHPGTPLEMLSGAITYLAWLYERFSGHETLAFERAVISDPEHYLAIVGNILLFMNVAAILYLGIRIKAATQSLSMALLAQAGVALLGTMIPRLVYLSPEALVIFSGAMVMACLSNTLLSFSPAREATSSGSAIAVGFLLALGLTAKITFLPLSLLVAVLPTKRTRMIGLGALIIFTVLFLLPIVSELSVTARWFLSITGHVGNYGHGQSGFIDIGALPTRLYILYHETGLIYVAGAACILAIAICIFGTNAMDSPMRRWGVWVSAVLLAILAVQLGIVLKHFAVHYILPSLVISSTILVWTLRLLEFQRRKLARAVAIIAAATLIVLAVQQSYTNFTNLSLAKRDRDSQLALLRQTLDANKDAIVIGSYRAREQLYAVQFGLNYVDHNFAKQVMGDSIQNLSYNRWNDRLWRTGDTWLELNYLNELIGQGRKVLMVLPEDIKIPTLQAEVLLQIPGRERILRVIHVQ